MKIKQMLKVGSVLPEGLVQDKNMHSRLEDIYYNKGSTCMAASEGILKDLVMKERYRGINFGQIQQAYLKKDVNFLMEKLGWLYVEDLTERDVDDLYCYICNVDDLKKLYDYSREGYMFAASLTHV